MKCPQCRTEMETRRENHKYIESGLTNVVLENVEKRRCPKCGETSLSIPAPLKLHKLMAMNIIRQPERLSPPEIRFLRKWMGWSGVDFAKRMGVDPATVSRWERAEDPQAMGPVAERLLRMFVSSREPERNYVDELAELGDKEGRPGLLGFKVSGGAWQPSVVAA